MRTSTRIVFVALLALIAALPQAALAQTADVTALGKQEYEAAKREYALGHYEKALEHFETSYRLTARPELLYNLGLVNKQLFVRTRNLDLLDQAIERFRGFLKANEDPQRKEVVERELAEAEEMKAREQATRAKGEEALQLGEDLVRRGKLTEARAQLDRYESAPGNERAGVVRALLLRGAIAAGSSEGSAAQDAYARALSLDAGARPTDPTAAQSRAFAVAQSRVTGTASVDHTPPASFKNGAQIALTFASRGDGFGLQKGLQMYYRVGGGKAFSTFLSKPGRVELPKAFTAGLLPGAKVEYYAVVLGEHDSVLQHLGTEALPFQFELEGAKGPPITKKWWFWTAAVAVVGVIGGGVALGVTLSQPPVSNVPISTGIK